VTPFILALIMTPAFLRILPSPTCVPEDGRNFPVYHVTSPSSSPSLSLWKLTFPYLCLRRLTAGRNISVGMETAVPPGLSRNCGSFPGRSKRFCSSPEIQSYFWDSPGHRLLLSGEICTGRKSRHSSQINAEVMNKWSSTTTSTIRLTACTVTNFLTFLFADVSYSVLYPGQIPSSHLIGDRLFGQTHRRHLQG